jgi:transcriptional regulator with XRE-family HTH domain
MDCASELKLARRSLGISQRQLAEMAHVSVQTVKAYENGRRNPTRPLLAAIAGALDLDRAARNRLFVAAGFAPDDGDPGQREAASDLSLEEAIAEAGLCGWPVHVENERMEVLAANRACQRLWGVGLGAEPLGPLERNMLSFATSPLFRERLANWDEVIAAMVGALKGRRPAASDGPGSYLAALIERLSQGQSRAVGRFQELWQKTPARTPKLRWSFEVEWREPGHGTLHFRESVSPCSLVDGLFFVDWLPTDAATWAALQEMLRG